MTNRQWLMWQLIDMSGKELLRKFPGVMCDVCADYITPGSGPCIADCYKILIDWLNQEHKEETNNGRE